MSFHCSNRRLQSSESAYGSRQHMQNHWVENGEGCLCKVLQGRWLCQVPRSCGRLAALSAAWWKEALWPERRGKGRGYGTADVAPWAHPVGISGIYVLPHVPPTPHTLTGAPNGDPALHAAPAPCGSSGTSVLARMLHTLKHFTELELYSACLLS